MAASINHKSNERRKEIRKEKKRDKHAASGYFEKLKLLNEIIDQGGEAAKDAQIAKANLSMSHFNKTSRARVDKKKKGSNLLDSRLMLPGSFEGGKRK